MHSGGYYEELAKPAYSGRDDENLPDDIKTKMHAERLKREKMTRRQYRDNILETTVGEISKLTSGQEDSSFMKEINGLVSRLKKNFSQKCQGTGRFLLWPKGAGETAILGRGRGLANWWRPCSRSVLWATGRTRTDVSTRPPLGSRATTTYRAEAAAATLLLPCRETLPPSPGAAPSAAAAARARKKLKKKPCPRERPTVRASRSVFLGPLEFYFLLS
jgi:hypothetical protein